MFYGAKVLQKLELCNTKYLFMVVFVCFAKYGLHFWRIGDLGELDSLDILGDLEDPGILDRLGDLDRLCFSGSLYAKKERTAVESNSL